MRATWHPSVPAPKRRHLVEDNLSKLSEGKARHLISFKFKSAADMANLQHISQPAKTKMRPYHHGLRNGITKITLLDP